MKIDLDVLATIIGMAAATYATRAGGYVLFRALGAPPIIKAGLAYLPGALFMSYVAPAIVQGGAEQWLGAVTTVALMAATSNLTFAILGGTVAAWIVWLAV